MVTGRREGSERQRFRISAQVWWVEGDLGVLELVKRGLGWSAIPEFLLHQPLKRGEVVVLEPDLSPATRWRWSCSGIAPARWGRRGAG